MFKVLFILLMLVPLSASAQNNINLNHWSQLPVLHEGRLKPIDSFARIHLKKFSTRETIDGLKAHEWLAQTIFIPEHAAQMPVFKVRNYKDYGLLQNNDKIYSYIEVSTALDQKKNIIIALLKENPQTWTTTQKDLIILYENVQIYAQLLRSLTAILPLNIKNKNLNYLDIKQKKGNPTAQKVLKLLEVGGSDNTYLRLIPVDNNKTSEEFVSIWSATKQENLNNFRLLKKWAHLAQAYRDNDSQKWNAQIETLQNNFFYAKLKTEYIYNNINLLVFSTIFYFLTFVLFILANILNNKNITKLAFLSLSIGAFTNAADIALRVYILARPPVGTLYESIIFVALICVLGFLLIEKKQNNRIGLLLGGLSGLLLLITAKSFSGDDTMNTLVAVLNTNFWLLTHVICITIGYAVCFLCSLMAHAYLVITVWHDTKTDLLKQLSQAIKTLLILALIFTTIGTILGGIWADQSWGRFWGWDPKENGALLIVLWLIWLLHSRISKHLSEIGLITGTAFLSIIVILAWFGVNLLNVGLHSYGFITGIALGITTFCIAEIFIIGTLYYLQNRKLKSPS